MELFYRLTEFSHGKNSEQEVEEKINNQVTQILSKNYLLIQLKNQCTDFIYQKCLISFVKAQSFKFSKQKRNTYEVRSYDSPDNKKNW